MIYRNFKRLVASQLNVNVDLSSDISSVVKILYLHLFSGGRETIEILHVL